MFFILHTQMLSCFVWCDSGKMCDSYIFYRFLLLQTIYSLRFFVLLDFERKSYVQYNIDGVTANLCKVVTVNEKCITIDVNNLLKLQICYVQRI